MVVVVVKRPDGTFSLNVKIINAYKPFNQLLTHFINSRGDEIVLIKRQKFPIFAIEFAESMKRIGKLYFRYGTMGSAKTAMLLTTAYNFEERGMAYRCFKPVVDTRDKKNVIRSRIGIERECSWIYPESNLYEEISRLRYSDGSLPDWILVDEAQFLSADQVDHLARLSMTSASMSCATD